MKKYTEEEHRESVKELFEIFATKEQCPRTVEDFLKEQGYLNTIVVGKVYKH